MALRRFHGRAYAACLAITIMATGLSTSRAEELAVVPAGHTENQSPYECPYNNGFYSTIVGNNSAKDCQLCNSRELDLCVPGFKEPMPIVAVMQPGEAPLVAILLGCEGKTNGPIAKTWSKWLYEAGYHVLTFNSSLSPEFIRASGRGVAGNILNEAECSRDIIGAFLNTPLAQGRVTKVGVVGMSYGGIQALLIGQMAAENKVTYKIDAIRSFSPPIDMMQSARMIDRWWREDRWNYTLPQMFLLIARHKPCQPGAPIPLSDSMMRAGVAASFRLPFSEIVDVNDTVYKLKILPDGDSWDEKSERQDYAASYGFSRFMFQCTFPYWKEKLKINNFSELNQPARLSNVLPHQPAFSEAIISADDPLNRPEDLDVLKQCKNCNQLTILHGGGHLGFVNDQWTRNKLMTLFKN